MISVLIVDDHAIIREGLKKLLSDVSGIKVVGDADSGEQALKLVRELKPDVILMDVKMPGIGGLEATRKLLRYAPDLKIIALSACDEEPFPSRLMQAGAFGYVTKGCSSEELVQAIRRVFSGHNYMTPDIAQQLALKHLNQKTESPFDILSERELQVMLMITAGLKVAKIAEKLCLSPKTVNSYRYRIFEKLKISSDVELTHLAILYGLIDKHGITESENETTSD